MPVILFGGAGLLAVLPNGDDDGLLRRTVGGFGTASFGVLAVGDPAIERLDRVLAVPAQGVADLVDHRAFPRPVPAWITPTAALQIFFFARVAHDPR